ncbi:M3 family metallopeptidase, partial [Bdellovibrionales bacterium]|nr:M3 family metallopeptidase [Bdellovibrionales bacterium]
FKIGLMDLDFAFFNNKDVKEIEDLEKFENQALKKTKYFTSISGAIRSCTFRHIFESNYAAGMYSYRWCEVMAASALEYLKEKGIFNSDLGNHFRQSIFEKGGAEDPMKLYIEFRGQKPDPKAFTRKYGI